MINSSSLQEIEDILKTEKPTTWGKFFPPTELALMPQVAHELILDALPQCGAIKDRQQGSLRVWSIGFNVHIGGTDPKVPYPFDFCVRVNGEQAGVNLLIRPDPKKFKPEMLEGFDGKDRMSITEALVHLKTHGFTSTTHYELIFLKTYRPACPGALQYGTAGGVFEVGDTAESVSIRETKEEFKGFKYLAWSALLPQQLYQSGNIFELQTIGAVLGYLPDETKVETEFEEGISDWKAVNLNLAEDFFDLINEKPWKGQAVWTDGKIHHGLLELLELMRSLGIE